MFNQLISLITQHNCFLNVLERVPALTFNRNLTLAINEIININLMSTVHFVFRVDEI